MPTREKFLEPVRPIFSDPPVYPILPPKHVPYAAYTDAHLMVIREQWDKKLSIQVVPSNPLGISLLTLSYSWTQFLEVLLGITGPIKDNQGRTCVFVFGPKRQAREISLIHNTPSRDLYEGIHVIRITSIIYQ